MSKMNKIVKIDEKLHMITKEFIYTGNVNDPKCTQINVFVSISFFNIPTHGATMCTITKTSQLNVK
jgi:hypothetical protein